MRFHVPCARVILLLVLSQIASAASLRPESALPLELSLQDACHISLVKNKTLKSAMNSVTRARMQREDRQADFYWHIRPDGELGTADGDAYAGMGVLAERKLGWGPEVHIKPYADRSPTHYESGISAGLQVPLLRGRGRPIVMDGVITAEFSETLTGLSLQRARSSVLLGVIETYYKARLQESLLELYDTHYRFIEAQVEKVILKESMGLATSMDVYRAHQRLNDDADRIAEVKNRLAGYVDQLKELLSMDLDCPVCLTPVPECSFILPEAAAAVKTALANRIDVIIAERSVKEAARQARLARHTLLPQLDMNVNYRQYGTGESMSEASQLDEHAWRISLGSTTDFFRRAERSAYRQELINLRNAELSRETVRQQVIKEVNARLESIKKNQEQMVLRRQAESVAAGKKELSQIKYMQGLSDNADTMDAEVESLQAQESRMTAEVDYALGIYQLQAAMGILESFVMGEAP